VQNKTLAPHTATVSFQSAANHQHMPNMLVGRYAIHKNQKKTANEIVSGFHVDGGAGGI
jgi:hypothetical protein